jgi:tripartite ATP-independent transporter DctM subunit
MAIAVSTEEEAPVSRTMRTLGAAYKILDKVGGFSRYLNVVALAIFFCMMLLTFADVFMRYLFNHPITGTKEYIEVLLVLVVAFTIAYTYLLKRHVTVDIFTEKLTGHLRLVWHIVTVFLSLALALILFYQAVQQSIYFAGHHRVHGTAVYINAVPFQIAIAIGTFLLTVLILRDVIKEIMEGITGGLKALHWVVVVLVLAAITTLAVVWMQGWWDIRLPILALIGIVVMLILMFSGMPTSFSLFLTGFLMIGHIRGQVTAFDIMGRELFSTPANYTWSVVGFFVLMGYLAYNARFGEDIYTTVQRWVGRARGGLAIATIGASTAMAGVVGDSLSVTTTMCAIAYPQMKKYGYSDKLATGTIASGALIGPLIPPSMGFIIYATLSGESLGKLFIAGIGPGLLMAILYSSTIYTIARIDPNAGPKGPGSTWRLRADSLKYGGPIIALFLLVIGGIYAGIFTATEGGSIGCVGALVIGLVMRRFTWARFKDSLLQSGTVLGMIFMIIVGATIFSAFLAWCNLSHTISGFVLGLDWDPRLFVMFVLLVFFAAGFFIDIIPMFLIGVPIIHPIIVDMGVNPIWFAVLVVITIQLGQISPPFATILFALKGILPHVKTSTIFTGIIPFLVASVIGLVILFFVPAIVVWIPNLLYK